MFGDSVIYVRNGLEFNALVLRENINDGRTLIYLDPEKDLGPGAQPQTAVAVAYHVPPMVEGALTGWKSIEDAIAEGMESPGWQSIYAQVKKRIINEEMQAVVDGVNYPASEDPNNYLGLERHPEAPHRSWGVGFNVPSPDPAAAPALPADEVRRLVFCQLERGEGLAVPAGARMRDFTAAATEYFQALIDARVVGDAEKRALGTTLLPADKTRELVFSQLDRGEIASEPDGANLADFIAALNEYIDRDRRSTQELRSLIVSSWDGGTVEWNPDLKRWEPTKPSTAPKGATAAGFAIPDGGVYEQGSGPQYMQAVAIANNPELPEGTRFGAGSTAPDEAPSAEITEAKTAS